MTLSQQLHASALHKPGIDAACPVCNPLITIIKDLERCARQNEIDAEHSQWIPHSVHTAQASAVAAEQRRIVKKLKAVR